MRERLIDAAVGPMEAYPGVREAMAQRMAPHVTALQHEIASALDHLRSATAILCADGVKASAVYEIEQAVAILESLSE